jgi:hypothetical protein
MVFYGGPSRGVIKRTTGARIVNWKGAAIQRGLEQRNSHCWSLYQATTSEVTAGWKILGMCSSDL